MPVDDARNGLPPGVERPVGGGGAGGAGVERVRRALAGTRFADVRWVATTGSTNADVMALARDGAPEGIVRVSDHQSAGRGRRARSWVAPPDSALLVSVLLRPPASVAAASTMAAAVAMADAVADVAGLAVGLKWPNDLVVGDRKLAGILAEADWPAGSNISAGFRAPPRHERVTVVVGVGLNVRWPRAATGPEGTEPPAEDAAPPAEHAGPPADLAGLEEVATALNRHGPAPDRADLLVAYLTHLDRRYGALVASGAGDLVGEWRRRSVTLGRRVRIDLGAHDLEGTAVDITDDGRLVVDALDGERRVVATGDVVHLRPA